MAQLNDLNQLYVKGEALTGQRVIAIQRHARLGEISHRDRYFPTPRFTQSQPLTYLWF